MSNISILSLQQVIAYVQPDEDFAPPPLLFFEADGATPISLDGINFTAKIGLLATLTNTPGGGVSVSGNSLTFFMPAAQKVWATGRYDFTLLASDESHAREIFAHSTLTVGQPASFSVTAFVGAGASANALSGASGAALLASIENMSPSQQQSLFVALADAQAAYVPRLDFSHVANSQYIGSTPFLFTVG